MSSTTYTIGSTVKVAGIQLDNALMNGAYINSKTIDDVRTLTKSSCGAIVVGSISVKPRRANPGHSYWMHKEKLFSLNSFGMPNGGIPYFEKALPTMTEVSHTANKPLIANLVGFTKEEFVVLIRLAEKSNVDMVELNFGCPNVWNGHKQKHILSYHADLVESTLRYIAMSKHKIRICVKISPLPPDILREVCKVICESGVVSAITATNSYPNAAVTTGAKINSKPDEILAGLAGRALKPISLGVVRQLVGLIPKNIDVIGCGGISSINDVKDYLEAGAKAVQIATALKDEGPSIFERILYQAKTT